ncbi:hypothetical protein A4H97_13265 [Niastella yeongjuensis]|uniref:Heparan-alpha-glucosaminide N-acetyltransferase catalytic domain-containing protein n=1 Tax=Niastella yeongjuensis TaxID=354355 RepID=A0A1V9EAI0_9BACT|nr:heparan-alpha-glucosaminide N-acetyltransferase domain-containing protein [Niastella yeongjuensis]OQP43106.1 hypothetical protein A4H97_13265 [Niastella yeongjuensis]SEO66646.1 Uncharacterized membrane protein [Niastella yeongjuensis]
MDQLTAVKKRVQSIDVLRGIVMIIMALDHVRDYFHADAFQHDPLDPATTTPILFFTRFITHFCAPTFVFLAGTSSYLVGLRKTKSALSSFLLKRGLWLILIEVVLISFGWTFNPLYNTIIFQVIWAIGISMVMLGLAVRLPYGVIFALGALIVLGHNLLDFPEAAHNHTVPFFWDLLHDGRFDTYTFAPGHTLVIAYAFAPWAGIMFLGYCAGKLFAPTVDSHKRQQALVGIGLGLIVLFVALRLMNDYGNPLSWTPQKTAMASFLSFMNVHKYPPSLMYTCITLGPALVALALLENVQNRFASFVKVFGRVPFFYYVLHLYLIHILTVIAFYASGYGAKDIVSPSPFFFRPIQFGYSLGVVYLIWALVILILYPLCRWYNNYKSSHSQWWLSYL